ncbi:hypothetical protein V5O48_016975 [Marasmius crinis-equi]|uniref:Uncharacterized protein n=1 Tax=Marasmius crinis-equi TaxID=585013 RepID=A0ABR3EQH3_9AGAR
MDTATLAQHRRVYVFAHARSCSHLFYKLLKGHPIFQATEPMTFNNACTLGTDRQAAYYSREQTLAALGMSADEVAHVSWQSALDEMQKHVANAESKGKWLLSMDHPYQLMSFSALRNLLPVSPCDEPAIPVITDRKLDISPEQSVGLETSPKHPTNPTLLPDRFFFSFTPIIVIRHPARTIPSYVRAVGSVSFPEFPVAAGNFLLERMFFDSFKAIEEARAAKEGRAPAMPIVVDTGKLVKDPRGTMRKVCEALGIDDGPIQYTWEKAEKSSEYRNNDSKVSEVFFGTFNQSTGVIPDHARFDKPLDIQEEERLWAEEWDESVARLLAEKVAAAMEDYEYLLQYSV